MLAHLPALNHGLMDSACVLYVIRINGHLGATMLSAFPAMTPQRDGKDTVLTGLLDRSALYGVLAEIDALGLDLVEVRQLTPERELPAPNDRRSRLPGRGAQGGPGGQCGGRGPDAGAALARPRESVSPSGHSAALDISRKSGIFVVILS